MGTALRILLVLPTDEVVRLSLARFDRLYARPATDSISELAGKRVRAAEAVLELQAGRPIGIIQIIYHYLSFDVSGAIDVERFHRDGMIAFEAGTHSFWAPRGLGRRLVEARHRFARRRRDNEVWWRPSAALARHIALAALDDPRYRRLALRRR